MYLGRDDVSMRGGGGGGGGGGGEEGGGGGGRGGRGGVTELCALTAQFSYPQEYLQHDMTIFQRASRDVTEFLAFSVFNSPIKYSTQSLTFWTLLW